MRYLTESSTETENVLGYSRQTQFASLKMPKFGLKIFRPFHCSSSFRRDLQKKNYCLSENRVDLHDETKP